ncbi:MAG: TSUP family transporter [Lentilactobacillus hilgardii]|jgi:uncharacterized membrane protein YfcA|uniref:Probable membrane transporter protein n=2 Tax=Lentilactobacillus hilgardii TaxID=1588 RepID=A0A6P1EC75_LENHI|nr:TSUP family transporter [Lentilactobacillus hilgardii]RRG12599.1 MAG: sulfite exporter TauE/SafE family protein [Lactobacillus sp.]EEI70929.1 hypothetical protein HMPREF0496_1875 [Lentilactobacillus hilgardii ATCC 27305]MBZ2200252.1 hypothetical protein [Lentilactobacillus hilgardii]MBZ2203376.1 hypothetical protein [Lentilactobacillus hilgardii]MCT3390606.1 sulfite exporter TauE/SafE family protein [Lentilactobacillus hilgardii]
MLTFIIVCPLVFLAGFVDAIAGGGGLISLPAYLMTGMPVHFAIGTNKLSSAMGTVVATLKFARSGYLRLGLSIFTVIAAILGSSTGSQLALHVSDFYFRIILAIVLPVTAIYLLTNKKALGAAGFVQTGISNRQMVIAAAISFVIGGYDGFYGPGTGTFLILLLTGLDHLPINVAAGTTKVINLTTNITALAVFLFNAKVLLPLGLTAGLFSIVGNYLGASWFKKGGRKVAKPIIIVVLVIFFCKLMLDFFK